MNPPARDIQLQVRDLATGNVVTTATMHMKRHNGGIDVWFDPKLPGYSGDIDVIEDYAVNEIHEGRYLDSNRYAPWNGWFITENLSSGLAVRQGKSPQLVVIDHLGNSAVIAGPGATPGLVFALDAGETFKMTEGIRAFREWFIQGHAKRAEENKKLTKLGPVQALVSITPSSMQRSHYGLLRMEYFWFPQSGSSSIVRRDIEEDAPGAESGNTVAREHLTTMEHELQRLGGPLNALGAQLVAAWNRAVSAASPTSFPLEIWARWYGSSDALQRDGGSRNDTQSVKMRVDIEPTKKSGPRRGVPLVTLTPVGMQEPRGIYRDLWGGSAYKKKPRIYGPYTGAELAAGNTGNYPGRFALKKNEAQGTLAWDRSLWLLEPEGVQQVLVALDARQEQGFSGR